MGVVARQRARSERRAEAGVGITFYESKRPESTGLLNLAHALGAANTTTSTTALGAVDRRTETDRESHAVARGSLLLVLVVVAVAAVGWVVVSAARAARADECPPIGYAVVGSVPTELPIELDRAMAEVTRRTGLTFVRSATPAAQLRVLAKDPGQLPGDPAAVAYGHGVWTVSHDRTSASFRAGGIEVARKDWPYGLHRGDTLATALVHELGHVLGLEHSSDPSSFMYGALSASPRTWTPAELEQLRDVGVRAGCTAPSR